MASGAQILPPVITGKITTRNHFNFKFGKIEVRTKLPGGSWLIPGKLVNSLKFYVYEYTIFVIF